ncbi:hypothetical protein CcCBS67573_g00726 [Chytriomyces confervae]|uniref:Extracellular metalloproteinase n=1 Tax=Chytriomyces confervae TaxID=246404 RepID=A0A507FNE8_9FUNG|nr:hypothetical protein CcCBS67573_g00726 [Chytriomyces confervae]
MHAPVFFLGLLSICAQQLHAAPLAGRDSAASVPTYDQPEAAPIDLSMSFPALSSRDGAAVSIDAIAQSAADALAKNLKITNDQIKVSHAHTSSGIHHVHFVQVLDGVEIANAVANVNINADGSVLSVFSSFVPTATTPSSFSASAGISVDVAVLKFAESQGIATTDKLTVTQDGDVYTVKGASFAEQDIKASKKVYRKGTDFVVCWDLSVDLGDIWRNAFVSIETGEIVGVSDWSSDFSDATYAVVPPHKQAPTNSQLTKITNPWDKNASPNGWHVIKGQERKDLYGNNVAAASNPDGSSTQTKAGVLALSRPSSESLTFDYKLDDTQDAMDPTNINAAVTNMFVATNIAHDFFYNYGFTEEAANFQFDNMGKGGNENDGVLATCQDRFNTDAKSRNNANFATPPDGQSGRMRMYVFDRTNPGRDGALDNGIVYHEFGHGLSNRLTGGGTNPNCLSGLYSGGMGEGWSDLWAVMLTLPETATRATNVDMGKYVLGGNQGIRRYPYSTSLTTNPHKYSKLATLKEVHDLGEVWCAMLYEVLWNMVDVSGWVKPADLTASRASGKGNADMAAVLIQGMKLQPCNPTFIQARNAILDADKALFNGKYSCAIWKGFAKRGMGVDAQNGGSYTDNFDIPSDCSTVDPVPPKTTSSVIVSPTAAKTSAQVSTQTAIPVPTSAAPTSAAASTAVSSSVVAPTSKPVYTSSIAPVTSSVAYTSSVVVSSSKPVTTSKVATTSKPRPPKTTVVSTCPHSVCSTGRKLTSTCSPCAKKVCAVDSYCCNFWWDGFCVAQAEYICKRTC